MRIGTQQHTNRPHRDLQALQQTRPKLQEVDAIPRRAFASFGLAPTRRQLRHAGRNIMQLRPSASNGEDLSRMMVFDIMEELDQLGVPYDDCKERADLERKLLEAR
jgi:hypothetical protein